ncbi:selenocysteine lyase/cysteine desulfurase [Pedobacter sp. UYP30]|uniref:aminotransferase class V-fold PLP-dependent enzyme n=1 Tax=Pedobacter sp. UYP30 TaxID=1756400 RepID=UPI003393E520
MNFKDEYPALQNCIYLDTASSGIISLETLKWRRNHDESFLNQGSSFRANQAFFLNGVRETISNFFNAALEHCFLVPNFSFGFNTFLNGLKPTSKFLLLESDYPSVNYAVKTHGFQNESIAITSGLEERLFEKIQKTKPDVFACSLVQYLDGYKIDLNLLKRIKENFPKLIIAADGTQYCGTENFDFNSSGLDFLGASGYKWMLAGYGNGFVFLKDLAVSSIYEEAKKTSTPSEPFLKERSTLGTFFEPGHLDTLAFGTLKQAIIERKEIGYEYFTTKISQLGQLATEEFKKRNILTKPLLSHESPQYIFNLSLSEGVLKRLTEKNIAFTRRGDGIRIGFHFYNEIADLTQLLSIIDDE